MKEARKKARPVEATTGQAETGNSFGEQYSHKQFNDILSSSQGMVVSLIGTGPDAAVSRRQLAEMSGLDERVVRKLIHQARLQGVPIISGNIGYYRAENTNDLRRFSRSMARRANMIRAVAIVMEQTAAEADGQASLDDWWEDNI